MTGGQDTGGQQGDDLGWLPEEPPATPTLEQQLATEQWEEFTQLAAGDLATSATRWQAGLTAVIGAAAAGLLVVKAPDASSLPQGWRPWVLAVMVLAAATGVVGLWCSLAATAGFPASITQKRFEEKYRTVEGFRRSRMRHAASLMRWGRRAVVVSIAASIGGASLLWLAPESAPSLHVVLEDAEVCGVVESGDQGEIHLQVAGEKSPRVIAFDAIRNLSPVAAC